MDRIKIYLGTKIYFEESATDSLTNFIYADIMNDGSNEGIRTATDIFENTNQSYPFTAYCVGEEEPLREKRSAYAKNKIFYDPYIGSFVSAKPAIFNMPMITFFNTPYDYQVAKKILFEISSAPIKLDVPIIVGDATTNFPIFVKFEAIERGDYAFNVQEILRVGDIYDLQHFARIEYHDIETDSTGIYPVDDMIFELQRIDDEDYSLNVTLDTVSIDYDVALSNSSPISGTTDVPVENSVILTFTVGMNETSVENAIELDPFFSAEFGWNTDSTSITIDPVYNLTSGTVYNVVVEDTAHSWYNEENLSGNVTITFETEG